MILSKIILFNNLLRYLKYNWINCLQQFKIIIKLHGLILKIKINNKIRIKIKIKIKIWIKIHHKIKIKNKISSLIKI